MPTLNILILTSDMKMCLSFLAFLQIKQLFVRN